MGQRLFISKNLLRPGAWIVRWLRNRLPVGVIILLLLSAALNYIEGAIGGLPVWISAYLDALANFSTAFLSISLEAAPFLLLGVLASGIVELFFTREEILRWSPRDPLLQAAAGSLIGLFFPAGEVGTIPLARRLLLKGMPVTMGVSMLLAAPVLNLIVIASTYAAFGPGFVFWGRLGLSAGIAVLTALIFTSSKQAQAALRQDKDVQEKSPSMPAANGRALTTRIKQAMLLAVDEFFEFGSYLVLGSLLAALIHTVVPLPPLAAAGQGPVLPVAAWMALSVLLSSSASMDAFIALPSAGSSSAGSILAFLLLGPVLDIKNVVMYLRVFKPAAVLRLGLIVLLLTFIFSVLINIIVPAGWF